MKTVTIVLELDPSKKEQIDRLAEARNSSAHDLLEEAIDRFISWSGDGSKVLADADRAWERYLATGLHATEEEVDAWLDKLEAGEDAEPPQCHT